MAQGPLSDSFLLSAGEGALTSSRETGGGIALGDILDQAFQGGVQKRRPGTWRAFQTGDSIHVEEGAGKGRLALTGPEGIR